MEMCRPPLRWRGPGHCAPGYSGCHALKYGRWDSTRYRRPGRRCKGCWGGGSRAADTASELAARRCRRPSSSVCYSGNSPQDFYPGRAASLGLEQRVSLRHGQRGLECCKTPRDCNEMLQCADGAAVRTTQQVRPARALRDEIAEQRVSTGHG